MATFNKVKSGITGLKKEREELRKKYQYLSEELARVVQENRVQISSIAARTSQTAEALAAINAKLLKTDAGSKNMEKRLSAAVARFEGSMENYRKAVISLGERLQQIQGAALEVRRGGKEKVQREKQASVYISSLDKRVRALENLREKVNEISQARGILIKGVEEMEALRGAVSGLEEKVSGIDSTLDNKTALMKSRLGSETSALQKSVGSLTADMRKVQEEMKRAALAMQSVRGDMTAANEKIVRLRETSAHNRNRLEAIGTLDAKIKHIESVKTGLVKGVESLKDIRMAMSALQEKVAGIDSTLDNKTALVKSRLGSELASVQKSVVSLASDVRRMQEEMKRTALAMQSVRKDISAGNERLMRIRETSAQSRKRLETLGTLDAKIKHIESVKEGLVKGVESLKGMRMAMSALQQKTRDIEARLTDADKFLDSKFLEKSKVHDSRLSDRTKYLESQIVGKIQAMETQMHERLEFLESGVAQRGSAAEKKLSDANRQFAAGMAGRLEAMGSSVARESAELKRLKAGLQKVGADVKALRGRSSAIGEKEKLLEGRLAEDITSLRSAAGNNAASLSRMRIELTALGKDVASNREMHTDLKADHSKTKKSLTTLQILRQRIRDTENLQKVLDARLKEAKPLQKKVEALSRELEAFKKDTGAMDAAIDSRIKYNMASLRKDTGFHAATLAKLDEDMKAVMLDTQSLKKDVQTGKKEIDTTAVSLSGTKRKLAELEKLQLRLKEIDKAKDTLGSAMEAKVAEKIKSLESVIQQRADSAEAAVLEKSGAVEGRLNSEIASIRKDLLARTKTIDSFKEKLDTLVRMQERLKFIDEQKEEIARNVASLQGMRAAQSETDEKVRNTDKNVRDLKSAIAANVSDLRSQVDSARNEKRDKFDTAVKAFLNARGELNNKVSTLDLRMTEMAKRVDSLYHIMTRMDTLEKKTDRLTERSSDIRRDVDKIGRRAGPDDRVMLVDLEKLEGAARTRKKGPEYSE